MDKNKTIKEIPTVKQMGAANHQITDSNIESQQLLNIFIVKNKHQTYVY